MTRLNRVVGVRALLISLLALAVWAVAVIAPLWALWKVDLL